VAATVDCLALSRTVRDDDKYGPARQANLDYAAKLMKVSARLTVAMAGLRGDTVHRIHVTRAGQGDKE
jgi:hypothetical protein